MDRIHQFVITVSPGTTQVAPFTQTLTLEDGFLVSVEVLIPAGHAGLTGVRIRQSRQQVLPWGSSGFLTADNYSRVFPVNTEIGSRAISVQAYNSDEYTHTFWLRFHIQDLNRDQSDTISAPVAPLASLIDTGFTNDTPIVPTVPVPVPSPPPPP